VRVCSTCKQREAVCFTPLAGTLVPVCDACVGRAAGFDDRCRHGVPLWASCPECSADPFDGDDRVSRIDATVYALSRIDPGEDLGTFVGAAARGEAADRDMTPHPRARFVFRAVPH
jgi:hypothetical protein